MQKTFSDTPVAEPIAIVGLSCKFAGDASTPEGFWHMLAAGRSAWSEIPTSRFNLTGSFHSKVDLLSTVNVRGGHFLAQDIGLFDAQFFNLSAEAAASLDPQIRLQLETVYEALENGGITLAEVAGTRTAVYAAVHARDYHDGIIRDEDNLPRLLSTGTGDAMFSNRISHFYDLRGPSFTLDTGCSGGLVALHQGVQSLRTGEADAAVICGSLISLNPDMFKGLGSIGFLSPDGRSYAFDSRANGYGRGEGFATVVIKRLSDAIQVGDPIRAIIRESGLNQDGKTDTITTPSQSAQVALMEDCYRRVGLDPLHTQYCEAHGTGTIAGDPIECGALAAVFKRDRPPNNPLLIGSVKTNIGHTESASGLAALIKVVLALEQKKIPPSINFEKPNPRLPLDDWRLRVVTKLQDWPSGPDGVRRASINNFGYGGTNAHLIVDSAPDELSAGQVNGHTEPPLTLDNQILVVSAYTEQGCRDIATNIKGYLERNTADDHRGLLQSVIHTLGHRRTRLPWVLAQTIPVQDGLRGACLALDSIEATPQRSINAPRVGMVFTGQGAQWYAMGRELIAAYPIFESSLREADTYIKSFGAEWSLLNELGQKEETSRVNEAGLSTPLCVAIQISLVRLLETWGVRPVAVTSHSSGEIAAAYAAGCLSYKSAMAVAYYRAILAADKTLRGPVKGGMVAVGLGVEQTQELLAQLSTENGLVAVACVNSPSSTTVSGDESALVELELLAEKQQIVARRVKVETAFHSHHMHAIATHYLDALQGRLSVVDVDEGKSPVAFSSPVTGCRLSSLSRLSEPEHWVDSLVEPVQFINALTDMAVGQSDTSSFNVDVIIEVGPHKALKFPIQEILAAPEFPSPKPSYLSCLVRNTSAVETMQSLAASLLMQGLPLNMDAANFPHGRPSSVQVLSDLPSYPWNHQHRYWCESRFNRALRERSQAPHGLLGSLVLGTDLKNPSWRHILRIRDTPWLGEHIIQKNIVFPAAGYISLAIEAIRQLPGLQPGSNQAIAGYLLRDIKILQALVFPETDEGVEIQTKLSNLSDKAIGYRGWKEFEVFSVTSENQWTVHARGVIMVEREGSPEKTAPKPRPAGLSGYTRQFAGSDLYADMRAKGLQHGKAFQAITGVEQAGDNRRADSILVIPDTNLPTDITYQALVHPTTLDAAVHSVYTPLLDVAGNTNGMVPRSIGSVWVSSAISQRAGHQFKLFTSLQHADARAWRTNITMADYHDNTAPTVLEMQDVLFHSLGGNTGDQQIDREWEKNPCFKIDWAPDLTLLSNKARESIQQQLSHPLDDEEVQVQLDLRRVCLYFISETLSTLTPDDLQQLQSHHVKFYTWMQQQTKLVADGYLGAEIATWHEDTPEERHLLMEKVRRSSINGELVCHLGPQIPTVLRQEKAPLELWNENNLFTRFYQQGLRIERTHLQAARVLQTLVHKNPRARILEIGGGTGSLTRYILPKISTPSVEGGGALADLYHFTDISTAFFDAAHKQFAPWSEIMRYDRLDIEVDPASQGFDLASYDIIIAAEVLHATRCMTKTMSHVRQLMKPGATLLMIEITQDCMDLQLTFGLLPGWWLGEEPERALGPTMGVDLWDKTLRDTGFSGIDFKVRDCESDEWYTLDVMTATAVPAPQPSIQNPESIALVSRELSSHDQRWLKAIQSSLAIAGQTPAAVDFETATADAYKDKLVVFLGEIEQPLLHALSAEGLKGLQAMMKLSRGVLWVTRGGAMDCKRPAFSLAAGFLRSLRHEYVGRQYITLDLDPNSQPVCDSSVAAIVQVLTTSFGTGTPSYECEYAERNGVIWIPRLFRDSARNQTVFPHAIDWSEPNRLPMGPFFQADRPLALTVSMPGLLDTIAFRDDPAIPAGDPRLALDDVEIEPRAFGVNFRDVLVAMGQLEECVMGVDGAGVITRVGSRAAAHGYAVGDRVFALLRGGFGSRTRVEWTNAMHIPPGMSFEQAASIATVYATVYLSLYKVAQLERGQTILIHAGAGGIGQCAIQFAKLIGAEVFTTVGSPEKRALVMERYGIPADHIFSSRDRSFAARIMEATNGEGVDVVLNSLAGPLLQESFNIVARFGHFIELGKRDLEQNNHLEMKPFSRHVTFSSFDLLSLSRHRKKLVHSALAEIARLFEENAISTIFPITTYPLGDVSKAFRQIQAGKHVGKIVLSVSPDEQVRVLPHTPTARLRSDASYLLVGGAGGIGGSIAHWLVAHGARNLIMLSRSVETNPAAAHLVAELQPKGCRVKRISCDVANEGSLAEALKRSPQDDFPPIRGVIQGAMVLKDSILERMTINDYEAALNPKVKASWNLHTQLRNADLDFFIFLSSMSGVGGVPSQSNYSAGNAYEDALAHWRVSQGLPAVAIDLGPVKGIGYVAENAAVSDRLTRLGLYPVTEEQVLRVLESAILSPFDRQIAVGLNQGPGPHWDPDAALSIGRDARFKALRYRQNPAVHTDGPNGRAGAGAGVGVSTSLAAQLSAAASKQEAEKVVIDAITTKLAAIFMIPTAHIEPSRHLSVYGLDSLGAVELRNMLSLQLAAEVSIFSIMQSESLAALASEVARKSAHVDASLFAG
ncbi:type I polyketide synthase [Aspergillus undulatus]|uniref:type I polyketide synthase n=1 Tax=Aspergillus undulatus TaxID=1810928 RepID=UPI003CCD32EA